MSAATRARLGLILLVGALALSGCATGKAPAPRPAPRPPAQPRSSAPPAEERSARPDLPPGSVPGVVTGRTEWLDVGVVLDAESVRIGVDSGETVAGAPEIGAVPAGSSLVVWRAGERLLVALEGDSGRRMTDPVVADDTVLVGGPGSGTVTINGKRYRGGAKLFRSPRGRLTAVNRVAIEPYLRGVLPHEIGKLEAATLEAGKAQAVAARTYTLSYVGRRAEEGFDLYDSVEDQVYGGTASETSFSDRAVTETRGVVVLHQGSYIRANYFSTCGGATVNVEDIWPDPPFPWLRQVEDREVSDAWCRASRPFRWTETWAGGEVLANLNRYGPEQSGTAPPLGGWKELRDVRVASRTPSGRVRELVFVTDRGEVVVWADKTRWVLRRPKSAGAGILRSSLFKLAVRKDTRGRVTQLVASGGGNGHGAGMCQVGALAQARAGRAYEQILRFYYTGVEIVHL